MYPQTVPDDLPGSKRYVKGSEANAIYEAVLLERAFKTNYAECGM